MALSTLTPREIFDRLGELQRQLVDNGAMGSALRAALEAIDIPDDIDEDALKDIVNCICEPFITREISLQMIIEVYKKMLDKYA